MQSKKSYYIFLLLLIFIASITYWRWISFNLFTSGDWVYYFSNTFNFFSFNYTWLNLYDLGYINLVLWRFIFVFPQSIAGALGYGSNVSEKILIVWPTIIFGNIFSFLLFRKILKSNLGAFIGAIVFNYNTYYLISSAFLLYSAPPWVLVSLLVFIKALETDKKRMYAISGITLFIAGSYDFRVAYIGVFLLFFYSLYYFLLIKILKITAKILKVFKSFTTFFIFGLLNIFWILPMLRLGSLTSNAALDRGLFGNEFLNILYSVTLFHPFWTGTKSAWFTVQPIMSYFWAIPILAFLGLWLNRKNKNIIFFGIVAILGIFLTKQIAIPFSNIYSWLFSYFPGFNAFREASKFYFLVILGYAVLIGAFISYLFENFKNIKIYLKYVLVIFIAFLFLWNVKPILTGEISGTYVPRYMPKDYLAVKNFIVKDKDYYRTLWIPSFSTWSIYTINHPIINIASALSEYNYWNSYINRLPIAKYSQGETMVKVLNLPLSNNLLDISSVKYIFVPLQDIENDADFFVYYNESRKYYINELDKITYLKKINIGTKDLVVYENKNYRPHVYATAQADSIKDLRPMIYDVRSTFISPSQYQVSIRNVTNPFYLNFSESFNPQWKLYLGQFNWLNIIFNEQEAISDKYHFRNDAGLNSFYINPRQVCKLENCKVNKDGTYDINLTLYFASQSYMYLGLIISGTTFVVVLGYMIFVLGKNLYERKNE